MENVSLEEVSLELSNRCYGRCMHCSSDSTAEDNSEQELPLEKWIDVIGQAANSGAKVISLSGGDPLIYPRWKTVVSAVTSYGMGVLFYTSGIKETRQITRTGDEPNEDDDFVLVEGISNLDLLHLKDAFSYSWGKIIFSLEGSDAQTHDRIVGVHGSFNNTLQSIAFAKEIGLEVELHFTPMAGNWFQIEGFLSLAKTLSINKVSFLRLVPQGRSCVNARDTALSPESFVAVQKLLYEWEGKPDFRIGCPLSFGHLLGYVDQRPRCHAGLDMLLIRPNGDVHACAAAKEAGALQLGNVSKCSLSFIWKESRNIKALRKFHVEDAAIGECVKCPWKYCCGGGCPAQRIIYNINNIGFGSLWSQLISGVDPMCPKHTNCLSNLDIRNNRKNISKREQDGKGNVVK